MTETVEDQSPRMKFKNVGYVELSSSGRSCRIKITDCPLSCSKRYYYFNREHIAQIIHGNRKDTAVYMLEPEE